MTSVERPFYFSSAAVKTSPSQLQSIECRKQSKICQLHHAGVAKRGGGYAAIPNPKSTIPRPANPVIDSLPLTLRAATSSLSPLRSDSVKKMLSELKNLLIKTGC